MTNQSGPGRADSACQ